jgi:hypothetical protein
MNADTFEDGYQAAIADMRWLADRRDEYGGPRNVENVQDYFALSDIDRRLYDEVKNVRHVVDIIDGDNDGYGWLPSWHWEAWDGRKRYPLKPTATGLST